jgi:hypothetical protein
MEENLKILKVEYLNNHLLNYTQISNLSLDDQLNNILQIPKMKTSSNGRRHQTIKSGISQQPLVGLYSNLKLMFIKQTIFYKSLKRRRPQMEDNLKIFYHLLDHTPTLS